MMAEEVFSKRDIAFLVARVAALSAMSYFAMKWLIDAVDPTRKQQIQAKERAQKLLKALGIPTNIQLSNHEMMIASNLVEPSSIKVSWDDIAGLESVIDELRETVILPIKEHELFAGTKVHGMEGEAHWDTYFCFRLKVDKGTQRGASAWTPGMWQDYDCKSHSSRSWCKVCELRCVSNHRQMVRRVTETCHGSFHLGSQAVSVHYIH